VIERIAVDDRWAGAGMELQVAGLAGLDLGLAGVEPEHVDPERVVVVRSFCHRYARASGLVAS